MSHPNSTDHFPEQNKGTSSATGHNLLNKKVSRRDILKLAGAGSVGLLLGAGGLSGLLAASGKLTNTTGISNQSNQAQNTKHAAGDIIPFYGQHQSGIITPTQNFLCFASFDLKTTSLHDVRKLFQLWTDAAAVMSSGQLIGDTNNHLNLPPSDTGEAAGLSPSRLTITFGVGPSFFDERFGLANQQPPSFHELPPFRGDALQSKWTSGDIAVQVCAEDLQVAFHAIRNLARIARGTAVLRWTQEGFQRTGPSDPSHGTPRNLMGFKDGTGNPDVNDTVLMNKTVWVQQGDEKDWMTGGSYMVARRIRIRVEIWDRSSLNDQEITFGRHRNTGAPIGSKDEFAPLNLEAKDSSGQPLIPMNAHSRLAHMNGDIQILRRAYSYSSGLDNKTGQLDAGLFFISYQRNIPKQFTAMQQVLAANDKLNEYISHVGSAVFACFPGASNGGYIGESLF